MTKQRKQYSKEFKLEMVKPLEEQNQHVVDIAKQICFNGALYAPYHTVWKEKGSKARIDVENPNPGVRAGQIHYQDSNNKKYYYNPNNGKFYEGKVENGVLAPKSIQDLLKDKKFKDGIDKGLKYLGEK